MKATPAMSRRMRAPWVASGLICCCATGDVFASSSPESVTTWTPPAVETFTSIAYPYRLFFREDPDLDLHRILGFRYLHRQLVGGKVRVLLAIRPHFPDADAAGRQDVGRHVQRRVLEPTRL